MHGFEAPALRNEFAGEPIEKFGMRRSRAARAEIARRGHETPTEMMLPEAVDQDAGGERVGRTGKPVGQRRSPARGSRPEETRFRLGGGIGAFWSLTLLVLVALEDRWKSRLHFVARLLIIAAKKDEGARRNAVGVGQCHRRRQRGRLGDFLEFILKALPACSVGTGERFRQFRFRDLHHARCFLDGVLLLDRALRLRSFVRELSILGKRHELLLEKPLAVRCFQLLDLLPQSSAVLFIGCLSAVKRCSLGGGRDRPLALKGRQGKERLHREVITLGQRLEFVMVATRATQRQAEKHAG